MANKSLLIAGGVCVLLAVVSFGIAWVQSAEGIEDIASVKVSDYTEGPATSFTYTLVDEDNLGSSGWYVMIDGDYVDADDNGYVDDCEGVSFTVTNQAGTDVTESSSTFSCLYTDEYIDPDSFDGQIVFGYVCDTYDGESGNECSVGEDYTITSETQLYIFDSDSYNIKIGDDVADILGGLGLGVAGACCCGLGGILLLVGLLTGGKPTPMVGYMPPQGMQQMGQMPQQGMQQMGQMPSQGMQQMNQMPQQTYQVGEDIDSSTVADNPVSVWD